MTAAIWFARFSRDRDGFLQALTKARIQRSSAFVLPPGTKRRYLFLSTFLPPVPCNTQVTTDPWEMVPEPESDTVKLDMKSPLLIACHIDESVIYTQVSKSLEPVLQTVSEV